MSRPKIATIAALLFIAAYVAAAVEVPELTGRLHWAVEAAYWCVAGVVWVFPVWWLMLWGAGKR